MSDLWYRSRISVCGGGVWVSGLWYRSRIGVCGASACVSDLCHRICLGVCRGGVCVSDLWRRKFLRLHRRCLCDVGLSVKGVSRMSMSQKSQVRVPQKSVRKPCQVRASHKTVK